MNKLPKIGSQVVSKAKANEKFGYNYDIPYLITLGFTLYEIKKTIEVDKGNWYCTSKNVNISNTTSNIFFNKHFISRMRELRYNQSA